MAARNVTNGFTLVEIIAVLVILGILAAVAIPKYQDLQQIAAQKANSGAIAAAQSRMTWSYAQLIITTQKTPTLAALITEVNKDANCGVTSTDFTVVCADGGAAATITATHIASQESNTGFWMLP